MLNAASRKTDQSPSLFHTDIGAAIHATLETVQFISYSRAVIVDTIISL